MHRQMAHNDSRTTTTTLMEGKKGEERRKRGNSEKDKEKLRVASWCDPVSSCILIAMCEATDETRRNPSRNSKGKSTRIAKKAHKQQKRREEEANKERKRTQHQGHLIIFHQPILRRFFGCARVCAFGLWLCFTFASHSTHSRPSCWLLLLYLLSFFLLFS